MARKHLQLVIISLVTVLIFPIVACSNRNNNNVRQVPNNTSVDIIEENNRGSGISSQIPKGTYVYSEEDVFASYTFSGNKLKLTLVLEGEKVNDEEYIYELVEKEKGNRFSKGDIILKHSDGEEKFQYTLRSHELRLGYDWYEEELWLCLTKK